MKQEYLESALNPVELPVVSLAVATPSLEDAANPAADGVTKIEKEIEIYGTMRDMKVLDLAEDWEMQEQWGLYIEKTAENASAGNIRVRMTQCSKGEVCYVQCIKTKTAEGNRETEIEVTVDMFEQFKRLAASGLRKKRYFFPIPNSTMKFEVDVFYGPAGTPLPQVKIDLELSDNAVEEGFDPYNVTLPFEMSDIRIIAPGRKNDEDLKYVRQLFRQYDIPNQYKEQVSQEGGITVSQEEAFEEEQTEENLLTMKNKLCEVAELCDGVALSLSYNGPEGEARIKNQLKETSMAIYAAYNN